MKTCPTCAFENGDEFPTCVMCNQQMVDVPSWTHSDPNHPEHAERKVRKMRSLAMARQIEWAVLFYTVIVAGSTTGLGFLCLPYVEIPWLTLFFSVVTALFIALGIARGIFGQFLAAMLQGGISVAIILYFGYRSPLIFSCCRFMYSSHFSSELGSI